MAKAALRDLDVDRFLEALKTFPRAAIEGIGALQGWGGGDPFNMPVGNLAPISESEWEDPGIAEHTKHAVLSFMLACSAAGRADVMADLRQKVMAVPGLAKVVEDLFRVMDEPSDERKDVYVIIPSIVGRLLDGEVLDADDVFMSAIYAFQFLENSPLAPAVASALMTFYERRWPEILEKRTFSMRSPATNGPIIVEAMRKGETAMQRMANMVLATTAASKHSLSENLRDRLSKYAAKRFKTGPALEE